MELILEDITYELVDKLSFGIIKLFGVARYTKLQKAIGEAEETFLSENKSIVDDYTLFIEKLELSSDKEKYAEDNKDKLEIFNKFAMDKINAIMTPFIVEELCNFLDKTYKRIILGAKIGDEKIEVDINDMTIEHMVGIAYNRILNFDETKKKIMS